jgi:hypothetical protein
MTIYRHKQGQGAAINRLGDPAERHELAEYGIDFVPFVHGKFRDTGGERGVGCFMHCLDKIDEVNRMATRLHQLLFRYNKPIMAVMAGGMDATGRPLPAVRLPESTAGNVELTDDEIMSLPGASSATYLIPPIQYGAALEILNAQLNELEQDLPELSYYRLNAISQVSGAAIRLLMSPALDKATEARDNLDTALIQADQMALTIGANMGLWSNMGAYMAGDFEHTFGPRPLISLSEEDVLKTVQAGVDAGIPLEIMLARVGWPQNQIDAVLQAQQQAQLRGAQLANAYLEQAEINASRIGSPDEP